MKGYAEWNGKTIICMDVDEKKRFRDDLITLRKNLRKVRKPQGWFYMDDDIINGLIEWVSYGNDPNESQLFKLHKAMKKIDPENCHTLEDMMDQFDLCIPDNKLSRKEVLAHMDEIRYSFGVQEKPQNNFSELFK